MYFWPVAGIFDRIAIRPPLGFVFASQRPSASSHAEELIRGRIMLIIKYYRHNNHN